MCTILSIPHYSLVGRTMDFPLRTPWKLTYLPVNYSWYSAIKNRILYRNTYSILGGMRYFNGHYLIGDGINEQGLFCAELFFPVTAQYEQSQKKKINLTPQDFITWVLGQHATVAAVIADLSNVCVVDQPWFDQQHYPFHWFLKDQTGNYVIEPLSGKLVVTKNEVGVLTNTPDYQQQLMALNRALGTSEAAFSKRTQRILQQRQLTFTGNNSLDRFQRAAQIAWQVHPKSLEQLQQQMKTLAIPQGPRHRHNYTHYQMAVDCQQCIYSFYDYQQRKTIKKELPALTRQLTVPFRFN